MSKWLIIGLCLWLALSPVSALAQTPATAPTPSPATSPAELLQSCAAVDESALQDELNTLTQGAFSRALVELDLPAIVATAWNEAGLTQIVNDEVDRAVNHVKQDTSFWDSFLSGWDADKAKALTEAIAGQAFASDAFRKGMDSLGAAVATEISGRVGVFSAEGVSAALYCMQTFIESRYANVVRDSFQKELRDASAHADLPSDEIVPGLSDFLQQHELALGGIGVIIATQVAKRLAVEIMEGLSERVAGRLSVRLLGRVGTDVIPLVGWVIGIGLFAWDVYSSRDGAIPRISEALKSDEAMAAIQNEVVATIQPELNEKLPEIARGIANDLYAQWSSVKREMRVVLDLAASNADYRTLLASLESQEELSRLVAITSALTGASGSEAVVAATADGSLKRAVQLNADVTPIIQASGSITTALAWSDAAGDMLPAVISSGLYKSQQPGDLPADDLRALAGVESPAAVAELALLPAAGLSTLLTLSSQTLLELSQAFTGDQLAWIADTMTAMQVDERGPFVSRLLSNPTLVESLRDAGFTGAGNSGGSIDDMVAFLGGPKELPNIAGDAVSVALSAPTMGMYVHKYGWPTTAAVLVIAVLLALIFLRFVYGLGLYLFEPVLAVASAGRKRGQRKSGASAEELSKALDETRREVERLRAENAIRPATGETVSYGGQKTPGYKVDSPAVSEPPPPGPEEEK